MFFRLPLVAFALIGLSAMAPVLRRHERSSRRQPAACIVN
jgi:hypothetical protein